MAKLYSSILNDRIMQYYENVGLMNEEQDGFRNGRSCQEHLFTLCNTINTKLQNNESTYVVFVDMQKAFDWVNRDLLHL